MGNLLILQVYISYPGCSPENEKKNPVIVTYIGGSRETEELIKKHSQTNRGSEAEREWKKGKRISWVFMKISDESLRIPALYERGRFSLNVPGRLKTL